MQDSENSGNINCNSVHEFVMYVLFSHTFHFFAVTRVFGHSSLSCLTIQESLAPLSTRAVNVLLFHCSCTTGVHSDSLKDLDDFLIVLILLNEDLYLVTVFFFTN